MSRCWNGDPSKRPTFEEISSTLDSLLKGSSSFGRLTTEYTRNVTRNIPDNYQTCQAEIDRDDYIAILPDNDLDLSLNTATISQAQNNERTENEYINSIKGTLFISNNLGYYND